MVRGMTGVAAGLAEFRRLGLTPVFSDGWDALHRLEGGARCGINVLRRPRRHPERHEDWSATTTVAERGDS